MSVSVSHSHTTVPAAASTPVSEIDRSLVAGVAWMGLIKWAGQLLAWLSTFVVARLLTPADYGVVGAASLWLGLLTIVSEFGIGAVVIMLRGLTPAQIRQINTVSVLFGLAGFALSATLARPVGAFFRAPAVAPVVIALSATFLIGSFRTVPWALLQRDMRFRRVAAFEGAQQVVLAVLSVTLAFLGFRYWTLVIASIVSTSIPAVLALSFHRVGYERPRWREIRRALTFSKDVIAQRIAWYTYSNSDFLVAGRVLGKEALGAYTVAWTLANAPIDKIGNVILQVTPSVLSAVQHDRQTMSRYVVGITEGMSIVTFPLFIGLALVAPDFVPLLLGRQWSAMVVPLQILSVYACFRVLLPLLSQVLMLTGHERFATRNMMLAAALLPATFLAASRWGITGIALGWIVVHPLVAYRLCDRALGALGLDLRDFFSRPLWPALSGCMAMAAAVLAVRIAWPGGWSVGVRLPVEIIAGAAAYTCTLLTIHRVRVLRVRGFVVALRTPRA